MASDSRTNAGVDYVSVYSKMHAFPPRQDRIFFLLSSGNLATTQAVINHLTRDLDDAFAQVSLNTVRYMYDAASYVGDVSTQVQARYRDALNRSGINCEASFILGGQIYGQPHEIYLIYPQGNYISASPAMPFLQIGENKYGKPILDRVVRPHTGLNDAARAALVSLDSTMQSNVSVGPPLELLVYKADTFQVFQRILLEASSPFHSEFRRHWSEGLKHAFQELPRFDWEL